MWRPWGKSSSVRIRSTSSSSSSPSSSFSCSSFKDIQTLCVEEPPQVPTITAATTSSSSCRTAAIFRQVSVANSLIRNWSNLQQPPQLARSLPEPKPHVAVPEPSSRAPTTSQAEPPPSIFIPGAEQRIVVYFTSLRVVRTTFEDCRAVRSILRGFRVSMDERDLSMDSGFLSELQEILGPSVKLTLPRVFIRGRYIGGAEEVRQLHETGELKKLVEGMPTADLGVCDVCGGYRFILCEECNGSRKLYTEKAGFKTCTACNENGMIRCPSCSCAPL